MEAFQKNKERKRWVSAGPGVGSQGVPQHSMGRRWRKHRQRIRPTHFLSLQVSQSQEIIDAIQRIQSHLVQKYPDIEPACVDPASAHLTLMVFPLAHENSSNHEPAHTLQEGQEIFASGASTLENASLLQPVSLTLKGLSTFNGKVLYLDVLPNNGLTQIKALAKTLSYHFAKNGIHQDRDDFNAHVTVAKLSNMKAFPGGSSQNYFKRIPEDGYIDFIDVEAGTVEVKEIHLCRMGGRQPGEYYPVEGRINLRCSEGESGETYYD